MGGGAGGRGGGGAAAAAAAGGRMKQTIPWSAKDGGMDGVRSAAFVDCSEHGTINRLNSENKVLV